MRSNSGSEDDEQHNSNIEPTVTKAIYDKLNTVKEERFEGKTLTKAKRVSVNKDISQHLNQDIRSSKGDYSTQSLFYPNIVDATITKSSPTLIKAKAWKKPVHTENVGIQVYPDDKDILVHKYGWKER